ncbi:ABC transporter permease [Hymenobacter sp. BRD67]|uniref:ABC transporter permease n=1 Tax=Hymenobacter sp. BRD67 TaxID=2675877 RepID=UPI0020B6A83E|nr:ABC transporter permease [Hymenobacter sp. BRD67]
MATAPASSETLPAAPDTAVVVPPPVRTPGYYVRQRLWANRPAVVGLGFIALCALVALLGYWILPDNSPNANNGLVQLQKQPPGFTATIRQVPDPIAPAPGTVLHVWLHGRPPQLKDQAASGKKQLGAGNQPLITRRYWLGTDKAGRDELSRLLLGTRISLGIGLVAVLISLALGVAVGAVAGYFGGWVDSLLLGLMTVVWSIPGIMLVIGISLALDSKGVWVSFVAVGLTMWVDVARVVRGQVLGLRSATFIEAGRVLGLPTSRLIFVHLLPNLRGPLIVLATSNFAAAILLEAGLSFLGLGVQPPAPAGG